MIGFGGFIPGGLPDPPKPPPPPCLPFQHSWVGATLVGKTCACGEMQIVMGFSPRPQDVALWQTA